MICDLCNLDGRYDSLLLSRVALPEDDAMFFLILNRKLLEVKTLKLGPAVLTSQSSGAFFAAGKNNAELHEARVSSACDADFQARVFNAIR